MDFSIESNVKAYFIDTLKDLGWQYLSEKECNELRQNDFNEPLLLAKLKEFLRTNYQLNGDELIIMINKLKAPITSLITANETITKLILLGEGLEQKGKPSRHINYIDYENPSKNSFIITEEFSLTNAKNEQKKSTRIDLVLFVNGIPLVSIELKNSCVGANEAISQLLNHQHPDRIENFYKFIQLCVASCGTITKYGTTLTPSKFYNVFKDKSNDDSVKVLCNNILKPRNLLEFISDFIFFSKSKDKTSKIASRYQQYFGIKEVIKAIKDKHGGLVWHTQGSGKSYTMLMLVNILARLNSTAQKIIITDRIELDEQIFATINGTANLDTLHHAKNTSHLNELLNDDGVGLITTTIFKFSDLKDIKNRTRFILIDEAHRSQNGELHMQMLDNLGENAYIIAFTGTPLLSKEKSSIAKYGGLLHTYNIGEAVEDGAIVPLLYENKMIELGLSSKDELEKRFDELTLGLSNEQKEQIKQKWAKIKKLHTSISRLEYIALDINEDFKQSLKNTPFNAMLATNSKFEAMKYYKVFKELGDLEVRVVISVNAADENEGEQEKWVSDEYAKLNHAEYEEQCKSDFKDRKVDLLIVVDKLLTGFDAPCAKKLYIDKNLKEHNLLQAIARVNRLKEGKDEGIIVDFRGLLSELDTTLSRYDALSGYDESDLVGAVFKIDGSLNELWESLAVLDEMFTGLDDEVKKLKILKDLSFRDRFCKVLARFSNLVGVVLNTRKLRAGLSENEREKIKANLKKYLSLRRTAQVFYAEDFSLKEYEQSMQKLLDEHLKVGQIYTLNEPLDILSDDFSRVASDFSDEVKAHGKLNALEKEVKKYEVINPEIFVRFSARIEEILEDYRAKRLSESEFYKLSCDLARDFKKDLADDPLERNLARDFDKADVGQIIALLDSEFGKFSNVPEFDESIKNKIATELIVKMLPFLTKINKLNDIENYINSLIKIYLGKRGR